MSRLSILAALLVCLGGGAIACQDPKPAQDSIYDAKADGFQQIAKGLTEARKSNKTVLVQFGADWCGWCHKLHKLFASDKSIAAELKKSYVVVMVDVNEKHNAEVVKKYDNPVRYGLPVIVVLDKNGKMLFTQDTGKLEEGDHHDPAKVLAFLKKWTPAK